MKTVFVGGGAHRLVPILRSAMSKGSLFEGGEINLFDLNTQRSGAVAKILMKTPEYRKIKCKITWGTSLEKALEGADAVGVILMAGSALSYPLGNIPSLKYGYASSDNVSPNGALLGVKGAPILLNIARKMEKLCPKALLLDFANPIAVHSAMINRHTKIEAVGVCGGYVNHQWDLSRLLGKDEQSTEFNVETAGVNHLSFIVHGTYKGKDLFDLLDRRLANKNWKVPKLNSFWSPGAVENITRSVENLARFYRELGVLIFSTEGDGMAHLKYEEDLARSTKGRPAPSVAKIKAGVKAAGLARAEANKAFEAHVDRDLDDAFWAKAIKDHTVFGREDQDIFVQILEGISGRRRVKVATSRLNEGAITGLPDDVVVEYSQFIDKKGIHATGQFTIPPVVHGLVSGLAMHQTMLGDACAMNDPELLAHAMLAYPVRPYSKDLRNLSRELIEINADQIPKPLARAVDYLK